MKNTPVIILVSLFLPAVLLSVYSQEQIFTQDDGGIFYESHAIKGWATTCSIIRGYVRIDDKSMGRASAGEENACLGKADNITVSLGDSGIAIVGFAEPVKNIDGPDFAVFENSFDGRFLELAFVEVSSDSLKWVRFPAKSLTPADNQTGTFGTTEPGMIYNLAGKYRMYYGTPFDLYELKDSSGIDINNIMYIKIIDVIGTIDDRYASYDAYGNKINDPWPTPFPQSGFDLDAVAILKTVTSVIPDAMETSILIYPNPASERINIIFTGEEKKRIYLSDCTGKIIKMWDMADNFLTFNIEDILPGIYFLSVCSENSLQTQKVIIH